MGRVGGGVKGLELGKAFEVSLTKCFCVSATIALSVPVSYSVSIHNVPGGISHLAERTVPEYAPREAG